MTDAERKDFIEWCEAGRVVLTFLAAIVLYLTLVVSSLFAAAQAGGNAFVVALALVAWLAVSAGVCHLIKRRLER